MRPSGPCLSLILHYSLPYTCHSSHAFKLPVHTHSPGSFFPLCLCSCYLSPLPGSFFPSSLGSLLVKIQLMCHLLQETIPNSLPQPSNVLGIPQGLCISLFFMYTLFFEIVIYISVRSSKMETPKWYIIGTQ